MKCGRQIKNEKKPEAKIIDNQLWIRGADPRFGAFCEAAEREGKSLREWALDTLIEAAQ